MSTLVFDSGKERGGSAAIWRSVFIVCISWFTAIVAIALAGGFNAAVGERPLAVLVAVLTPVALFGLTYMSIKAFRSWVLGLDMRHLILLHSWRMVGMGFVFLYFHDRLPAMFALPAGLGDAMAAMGAVFLGIALYERASTVSRTRVFIWNAFGLIDFVIAVSLGVMTRTGEIFHFSGSVGSEIMGTFPLALIPGFAVPFYVITHLIIYAKLRQEQ